MLDERWQVVLGDEHLIRVIPILPVILCVQPLVSLTEMVSSSIAHPHVVPGPSQHESLCLVFIVGDPCVARVDQTMEQQHSWSSSFVVSLSVIEPPHLIDISIFCCHKFF